MTTVNLITHERGMHSPPIEFSRVRLNVLDALRGFAILGIFLINLPMMGSTGELVVQETHAYLT